VSESPTPGQTAVSLLAAGAIIAIGVGVILVGLINPPIRLMMLLCGGFAIAVGICAARLQWQELEPHLVPASQPAKTPPN